MQRLARDDKLRNDPSWPSVVIDDLFVQRLHEASASKVDDAQADLVGAQIKRFRAAGHLDADHGSD